VQLERAFTFQQRANLLVRMLAQRHNPMRLETHAAVSG
jgi:hypothetical protein